MNKKAIGIDFGGTSVKPGVVADGKILELAERISTRSHQGAEALLAAVVRAVKELRARHPEVQRWAQVRPGWSTGKTPGCTGCRTYLVGGTSA